MAYVITFYANGMLRFVQWCADVTRSEDEWRALCGTCPAACSVQMARRSRKGCTFSSHGANSPFDKNARWIRCNSPTQACSACAQCPEPAEPTAAYQSEVPQQQGCCEVMNHADLGGEASAAFSCRNARRAI
jgi:hypothetical protein